MLDSMLALLIGLNKHARISIPEWYFMNYKPYSLTNYNVRYTKIYVSYDICSKCIKE